MYKSKEHKLALLDEAVKLHDGNAIMAVSILIPQCKNGVCPVMNMFTYAVLALSYVFSDEAANHK